ncbi:helix-turn-helix domain-containing protein [Streptomyces sp. SR27]|uniref:helix-turn-helix domain-containing protein n=1 Tax=Streptomyces sp. SR27 TaxID=3076630 RepID=UPI00295BECCB|nr:helix-turn-helix domain-containing protein [Streptomyces sp. SR27]MDV9190013.1 helix-turn-helix domain-containing protein [Streptomyces sp. SR27]
MPLERRDDGTLVFGYLDTTSEDRAGAFDTVLVRAGGAGGSDGSGGAAGSDGSGRSGGDRESRDGNGIGGGSREGYTAELRPCRFGALSGCHISGEQRVRVMPRPSPAAPRSGHLLGFLVSGRGALEQDGRRANLAPGEFVLYTGARPFQLELDAAHRYFVLSLDPGTAGLLSAADLSTPRALTANAELPRSPSGRVLAAVIGELASRDRGFGPLASREMGEHVSGILRTLLRETAAAGTATAGGPGGATRTLERILAYIDDRLAEDLSPGAVAAAHHISVRQLHVLFRESGVTVGDHVRQRRLERIRRDLVDPALAHLPAYALAARWGLGEASHFSRVFRAEFGLSPRAVREQARTPDLPAGTVPAAWHPDR